MKTSAEEYHDLKTILALTEIEFQKFHRIWEKSNWLDVNSGFINPGDLFLAQKGFITDGHLFIPQVLKKGGWVLADPSYPRQTPEKEKSIVRISNLVAHAGKLGVRFYHRPSERLRIVGVTGTDGKTSTVRLLAEAYHRWGYRTAAIGTTGVYMMGEPNLELPHKDTPNTTPDPIILQRLLYSLHLRGVDTVVMEVSSHGLSLGRVKEVAFDSGVWINISPEHLDFHGDLESYAHSKALLFEFLQHSPKKNKHGVMGLDSFSELAGGNPSWIEPILEEIKSRSFPLSFFHREFHHKGGGRKTFLSKQMGIEGQLAIYASRPSKKWAQEVVIHAGKNLGSRKHVIPTELIGQFNAQNLTAAFLETEHFRQRLKKEKPSDLAWESVKKSWKRVKVKGRLEFCSLDSTSHPRRKVLKRCHLYIDYAHTPQALEKSLTALKGIKRNAKKPLLCVFGCGGDRDPAKRKPMGRVACRQAEISLVTDDNPRNENPGAIRQEIVKGWREEHRRLPEKIRKSRTLEVIPGRKEAIRRALEIVEEGGVILLAGKGHEDYQIIHGEKFPFDEREVLKEILS